MTLRRNCKPRKMMRSNSVRILTLFGAILGLASIFVACSGRPDGVLGKEEMAQLLADIHKGESVVEINPRSYPDDSTKRAFRQSIYAKHGITSEQVDSSLMWYGYNMDKFTEVYDRTIELLEDELASAQENAGSSNSGLAEMNIAFEGDSVDVWPGVRYRRLAATMPSDYITFGLSTDRHWERGDVYTLHAKAIDIHSALDVTLAVDYTDGTKEYVHRMMADDGWHDMSLALDSAKIAQYVYGYIHYKPGRREVAYIDSIMLVRTRIAPHNRSSRSSMQLFNGRKGRVY